MSSQSKRKEAMADNKAPKRVRKECSYGEKCYRRNPAHLREFVHTHLEEILDEYDGSGTFPIPSRFSLLRDMITEQLEVMIDKKIYEPGKKVNDAVSSSTNDEQPDTPQPKPEEKPPSDAVNHSMDTDVEVLILDISCPRPEILNIGMNLNAKEAPVENDAGTKSEDATKSSDSATKRNEANTKSNESGTKKSDEPVPVRRESRRGSKIDLNKSPIYNCDSHEKVMCKDAHYRPMVEPKRRAEDYLKVVAPRGKMAAKHAASAPYHLFYTAITDAPETHKQPYSITFLELLDSSLGELKSSLQINFMVEAGWLLAQYYFAGYSEKRMTILYGEDTEDMRAVSEVKPHIDTHRVTMPTPFGKHHTKMMILCYEDGSLRVVVSTANLYVDDWENRTQGLWLSPKCPELRKGAMPHEGESPTMFKRSLLRYLSHYHLPCLAYYMERVKRCDFSHVNVFLVTSAPGSHFDAEWGLTRVGALLRQHCAVPRAEGARWPLLAQASSIGSFGKEPRLWLTGDFLNHFTKSSNPPQVLTAPPELKIIYPSLENVRASHDNLLGGGCLPYAASAHAKQLWLNNFLYQWKAKHTNRDQAMPHIKTYTRVSPDNKRAAFYLLTSGNISKAAWGSINKGNAALRVMSYEAGVLFLPKFVIDQDFFPLETNARNRLIIPYDIPPTKYTSSMSPWVSDYLNDTD